MTNPQGTVWETEIVNGARRIGRNAGRYPKMASKGEPDVWIARDLEWFLSTKSIPVVAWKRLVGTKSDGRRKPDGERHVVIIGYADFLEMLPYLPNRFEVQAKWTSTLNVTRTLADLRAWLKDHE